MPLYEMTSDAFRSIAEASFADLKVRERGDLQRLLRLQIDVIGKEICDDLVSGEHPNLFVLTEEFCDWEESKRRIDLLALDRGANLVVIELKRTGDGGHMELQAIRYAAMVSKMTFAKAVQIHSDFRSTVGLSTQDAEEEILAFLGWEKPDSEQFAPDVRIVLASEDFGIELTTAVLWLRERDIDIRCVRLRPYLDGQRRLVDVQQIIPLPEADDYQVKVREKAQEERKSRAEKQETRKRFWNGVIEIAKKLKTRHAGLKAADRNWLPASAGSTGRSFTYVTSQDWSAIELYIDVGDVNRNKAIFDQIACHKASIDKDFGAPLSWQRLDDRKCCRIRCLIDRGGYKLPESQWPSLHQELVENMIKLEQALLAPLEAASS